MLERGFLPAREVAPILRQYLVENFATINDPAAGNLPRILYRWENEVRMVRFQTADDLFTALGEINWWFPISELYDEVALTTKGRKCACPGCTRRFTPRGKGVTAKKYCSKKCARTMERHRYIAKKTGTPPPILRNECKNRHPRTRENTRFTRIGYVICLDCRRPRQRDWVARKRALSQAEV